MYNNEKIILDLRLNYLDKYVEKFILVESKYDHQGNLKKNCFNIDNFQNYKKKIVHLLIDQFPSNISNWEREKYQRNYILRALKDLPDDDFVMISDNISNTFSAESMFGAKPPSSPTAVE